MTQGASKDLEIYSSHSTKWLLIEIIKNSLLLYSAISISLKELMLIRKHNTAHVFSRKNRETVGERILLIFFSRSCLWCHDQHVYLNDRVSSAYHWKRPLSMTHFFIEQWYDAAVSKETLNLSLSFVYWSNFFKYN